ncbi:MAG: hypothetical protein ABI333_04830 [bacterium]
MDNKNLTEMSAVMHEMFTTGMNAMNMMQEQAEKVAKELAKELQDKNMEAYRLSSDVMDKWISAVRQGQTQFRKIVDESFKRAESHLDSPGSTDGKKK